VGSRIWVYLFGSYRIFLGNIVELHSASFS
jgi:hypothetical protein